MSRVYYIMYMQKQTHQTMVYYGKSIFINCVSKH